MIDLSPTEKTARLLKLFQETLNSDGYRIELSPDSTMRVCGVSEGELFFALRCKVFKIAPPTPPPKKVEPVPDQPESHDDEK